MNKTSSLILLALVLLTLVIFSTCYRATNCCGAVNSESSAAIVPMGENLYCSPWTVSDGTDFDWESNRYLRFVRGEATVLDYSGEPNNLLSGLADYLIAHPNRELVVTGIYAGNEDYSGESINLGIARAESVRGILTGLFSVPDEQIISKSDFSEGTAFYQDTLCHGAEFTFTGEPNAAGIGTVDEAPSAEAICSELEQDGLVLYFDFSSAEDNFAERDRNYLNALVSCLGTLENAKIEVEGHTDNVGGSGNNQTLSRARARKIRSYLVANGISKSRISIEGYGEDSPVADNDSEEGRAKNRRVEIKLVK